MAYNPTKMIISLERFLLRVRPTVSVVSWTSPQVALLSTSSVQNAARKGTREKRKKDKVKKEEKKDAFVPRFLAKLAEQKGQRKACREDDSHLPVPCDDVWSQKLHRQRVWSLEEAVSSHREALSSTMMNVPGGSLQVLVEMDLRLAKKTRFLDTFTRVIRLPFWREEPPRSVLAFARTPEIQEEAMKAGASLAGGPELVRNLQMGKVALQDFQHFICHPNMITEIVPLRGLLKKRFPSQKTGNLGIALGDMLQRFRFGLEYSCRQDEVEKDFGWVEAPLGKLNQDLGEIESNLRTLLEDIDSMRPKRPGPFITRCLILAPPSEEKFKLDHSVYVPEEEEDMEQTAEESTRKDKSRQEEEDEQEQPGKEQRAAA